MNDPQKEDSLRSDHAELEQFEQQLRSLEPRAARFQLSEVVTSTIAPTVALATSAEQQRGRTTYALTLLATWSLGAAAGVLITLGVLNPSVIGVSNAVVEHAVGEPSDGAKLSDASRAIASVERGVNAKDTQSEILSQSQQATPPSPFAIALFPWQTPLQRSTDTTRLTAFSHVFPISELDATAMRLGNPSLEAAGASTNSDEVRHQTPIIPVKISVPPPASRREMLHELLDSYGSIY